eukprot:1195409-Prorocentrum_minimum.AAC.3
MSVSGALMGMLRAMSSMYILTADQSDTGSAGRNVRVEPLFGVRKYLGEIESSPVVGWLNKGLPESGEARSSALRWGTPPPATSWGTPPPPHSARIRCGDFRLVDIDSAVARHATAQAKRTCTRGRDVGVALRLAQAALLPDTLGLARVVVLTALAEPVPGLARLRERLPEPPTRRLLGPRWSDRMGLARWVELDGAHRGCAGRLKESRSVSQGRSVGDVDRRLNPNTIS